MVPAPVENVADKASVPEALDGADVRGRIVAQARECFFRHGYRAFTMDDLAAELGMSKKTLYVHFRSKDEMIRAVFDGFALGLRREVDALLADPSLSFAEKLRGFAGGLAERFSRVNAPMLAEVQRFAPELHRHIEQLRSKNIPYIFGRFIEEGQVCGAVRDDVSPVFAGEYYLHAMQGLMQPAALQRLRITPEQALERALRLFFGGLFTPAGQKHYEKLFPV